MNRYVVASVRAVPITLLLFGLQLLLAAPLALPLSLELSRLLPAPLDATTRANFLDALVGLRPLWRALSVQAGLALGAWFVLSPLLHVAWLSALSTPMSPARALGRGLALLPRALCVSLLIWLAACLLALPFGLLAWGLSALFDVERNARVHDLALLCALSPVLVVLLVAFTWHDLARARCLEQGFVRSVTRSARAAFRPGVLLRALLLAGLGTGLVLLSQRWAPALGHTGLLGVVLAGTLVHGAVFTKLLLRSFWLCHALACAEPAEGDDTTIFQRSAA